MNQKELAELTRDLDELTVDKILLESKRKKLKMLAEQHRDDLSSLEKDSEELDKINADADAKEKRINEITKILAEQKPQENRKEIRNIMKNYTQFADGMDTRDVISTEQYRSAFLRNLQSKGKAQLSDVEKRAMSTANNGAVIPTQTLDMIMGQLLQFSPLLSSVRVLNIPSNVKIPAVGTVNNAEWVSEGSAGTINIDTTRYISLAAHQLIRLIEITAQVEAMSISAFETWLSSEMARRMRGAIEYGIYKGSGVDQPTGFSNGIVWDITNSISVLSTALTYDNLVDLENLIDSTNIMSAYYIMDRASLAIVRKLKDDTKRPLYERAIEDGFMGTINGFPVKLSDDVKGIYIANWTEAYVMNFAAPIEMVNSMEAGFAKNTTVFRGTALADGKPTLVKTAIAKINFTDLI